MRQEKDYLDELIEDSRKDPLFDRLWISMQDVKSLVELRVKRGLSQEEVAKTMGIARPRVAELEADPGRVSFNRLALYAAAIGATIAVKPAKLAKAPEKPKTRGRKVGTTRTKEATERIVASPRRAYKND